MGLGNNLIMESLKNNQEEIAREKASGEKLSFGNWLKLICHIGLLLCSIAFGIIIILAIL